MVRKIPGPDESPEYWRREVNEQINGYLSVSTITEATTISTSGIILCDATAGAFTVTLPPASKAKGKQYLIKKIDSSGNAATIDGNGSETIDGSTTVALSSQYDARGIVSDGTSWYIIRKV